MKNKILIVAISFILIATTVFAFTFTAPTKAAVASAESIIFALFEEDTNHFVNVKDLITNKQAGIYFQRYTTNYKVLLQASDGNETYHKIENFKVMIPIRNNVTYRIFLDTGILNIKQDTGMRVTYDIEKPRISAYTEQTEIKNNETVIGKSVTVKANDNFGNLKLYMSKNDAAETLCERPTFTITDDGKYTFYAVDIANNYSDDFTITYFQQPPEESPDEPEKPSRPSKPSKPTPDEKEPPVAKEETKQVNQTAIIVAVVIFAILLGVVVFFIYYKRHQAKAAQFDDDE